MSSNTQQKEQKPFKGCSLSVQLNGLDILTIDEGHAIKEVLSFISRKEKREAKACH